MAMTTGKNPHSREQSKSISNSTGNVRAKLSSLSAKSPGGGSLGANCQEPKSLPSLSYFPWTWPKEWRMEWKERAAIMEHDGGLTKPKAEAEAMKIVREMFEERER